MAKVNIKIEGIPYEVEAGMTILEAARACGYEIPSLCAFNHGECNRGSCRVCLVEATGARGLVASCVYPVNEGMEITISSPKATAARRASVELLLSNHSMKCQQCEKNEKCELLHVARLTGAREDMFEGSQTPVTYDDLSPSIVRDTSKCVLCGRCVARCQNAHGNGILGFENRGFRTIVAPAENRSFVDSPCIMCGQCVSVCPTGALMEKSEIARVDDAFRAGKYVVVQTAPAVRAALGEEFGMKIGTPVTGKMVAALRRLGFKKVFDTDYGADLTIMEEASEFIDRFTHRDRYTWPMFTSCCPGWVRFLKSQYPDMVGELSTAKSPQQMFGAVTKTYFAKKIGVDPKNIVCVSVMPCVAKKAEVDIPNINDAGAGKDVDYSITTREICRMISADQVDVAALPETDFDSPLGTGTGAAVIFGVTGGVMEAALRTCTYVLTGKNPDPDKTFLGARGMDGWKEAEYDVAGVRVRTAVVSGLGNARRLIRALRRGEVQYDFVEVMACPGGCVGGGGQPIHYNEERAGERGEVLYRYDQKNVMRFSHENPEVQTLYSDFLGKPCGETAHHLLHTDHFGWQMPLSPNLDEDVRVIRKV